MVGQLGIFEYLQNLRCLCGMTKQHHLPQAASEQALSMSSCGVLATSDVMVRFYEIRVALLSSAFIAAGGVGEARADASLCTTGQFRMTDSLLCRLRYRYVLRNELKGNV